MSKEKSPSELFGAPEVVKTESGRVLRIEKWSVRKAMVMGKALSNILKQVFETVEKRGTEDFRVSDLIESVPSIMESCSDELAFIVSESLRSDAGPQLSTDEILDTFTLEDFADVLGAIIAKNITDRMLGKWGGLLQRLPLVGESKAETSSPSSLTQQEIPAA